MLFFAQTQYDYMNDDAVAGGADRALNGLIIIVGLIVIAFVLILLLGGLSKVYYWFNPQADPEYKRAKLLAEKKKEEERIIAQKRKDAIPEAIDLGLSVKWASFNLGAYKPSDPGSTFYWGEKCPSTDKRVKANRNVNAIGDISGDPEYDAATNLLGGHWRMPTPDECKELLSQCIWKAEKRDCVEGRLVTGPSGNSIFLPYNQIDFITKKLKSGNYWTSYPSFIFRSNNTAQDLRFGEGYKFPADVWNAATANACLFGIRPVYDTSRKKTKEEKKRETLNAFSQINQYKHRDLDFLYKCYEKQCSIREDEKKPQETLISIGGIDFNKDKTYRDDFGVVYSKDGKRLLDGGDCINEIYEVKEGTEFICFGAFNASYHFGINYYKKKNRLTKIVLPSSLLYLTERCICDNCEIESRSPYYSIIDNLIIDNRKKSIVKCLDKYVTEVVIGEPIEEIDVRAFINCEVLKKVTLPNSLKRINEEAFYNNEMLEIINLPDSIEIIEKLAFFNCKCLHIDRLPNGLTYIGDSAFTWCIFYDVIIPQNIHFIGDAPFPKNCSKIQSKSKVFVIENGLLIDKKNKALIQFVNTSIATVAIPHYLTRIRPSAFHHCDIESLIVPSNIIDIGSGAFYGCKYLREITFEGHLPSIPKLAFSYCESLSSIIIPQGVETIELAAFDACKNLKTIKLNDGLRVISNNAFVHCPNLSSLVIPESVEVIGEKYGTSFNGCPNLHELYYGARNATVSSIPDSVKTLTIGEHVEVLPRWLVPSNSSIESLTIPESVRKVCCECILGGSYLKEISILSRDIVLEDGWIKNCPNLRIIWVNADMYDVLLPQLPQRNKLKTRKIFPHKFLFFKW